MLPNSKLNTHTAQAWLSHWRGRPLSPGPREETEPGQGQHSKGTIGQDRGWERGCGGHRGRVSGTWAALTASDLTAAPPSDSRVCFPLLSLGNAPVSPPHAAGRTKVSSSEADRWKSWLYWSLAGTARADRWHCQGSWGGPCPGSAGPHNCAIGLGLPHPHANPHTQPP